MTPATSSMRFYHLTTTHLDTALAQIIDKVNQMNWAGYIYCQDAKQQKNLSTTLWSHRPENFIPHATLDEDLKEGLNLSLHLDSIAPISTKNKESHQKILDQKEIFISTSPLRIDDLEQYFPKFKQWFHFFHADSATDMDFARLLYKKAKELNQHELTYWKQQDNGSWQKM